MEFSTNEMRIVPSPAAGDVFTEVIRHGAKQILSQAIEAEVADWIARHKEHQRPGPTAGGSQRLPAAADHPHRHRPHGREATARA